MNYIVIELQTNGGTTANVVNSYSDRATAEAKFHQVLAAAATSAVEIHAAVMLAEDGRLVRQEHYLHQQVTQDVSN